MGRKEHELEPSGKIHGINSWTNHSNVTVAQDQLYGMLAISCFLRPLLECLIVLFDFVQRPFLECPRSNKLCAKEREWKMKRFTCSLPSDHLQCGNYFQVLWFLQICVECGWREKSPSPSLWSQIRLSESRMAGTHFRWMSTS